MHPRGLRLRVNGDRFLQYIHAMRQIIVSTTKETAVPIEQLHKLRKDAFMQWEEAGLHTEVTHSPLNALAYYIRDKAVFVARDAQTGELLAMHTFRLNKRRGTASGANLAVAPHVKHEGIGSRMLWEETERLRKAGYRFMKEYTAIPAKWSVKWHLKNGYYITGYKRSEKDNYSSYAFCKPIALDFFHHPTDLFWVRPIAPYTACLHYIVSYFITCVCKTRSGRLTAIGRMAKYLLNRIRSLRQS